MSITSGLGGDTPSRFSTKLPFDVCFPAHLKRLLRNLTESAQHGQSEQFQDSLRLCLDFLIRFWTGAALGALERLQAASVPIPSQPTWSETLRLLRYAVSAWEGHQQSSFRTLLRLGFFEAGDPPRPRLQCRWLGIAGEWPTDLASADHPVWEKPRRPLPGSSSRYLEIVSEWLRASRPLFVKLKRRYEERQGLVIVTLEDGRGKQLPLMPEPPWHRYAPDWRLEKVMAAEAASSFEELPLATADEIFSSQWFQDDLSSLLGPTLEAPDLDSAADLNSAEFAVPDDFLGLGGQASYRESMDPAIREVDRLLSQLEEARPAPIAPQAEALLPLTQLGSELEFGSDLWGPDSLQQAMPVGSDNPVVPGPELEDSLLPSLSIEELQLPEPVLSLSELPDSLDSQEWVAPVKALKLDLNDSLDALLGLDSHRAGVAALQPSWRWRPRPLEFPANLPVGVRRQLEIARRALLDYSNFYRSDDEAAQRTLATGLLQGLSCLLELTARVACLGLAQVAPLPEPLRLALRQPLPVSQSVKLLHFAWTALGEHDRLPVVGLLQNLLFELDAPDVPRLHSRWLGLPDAPMIGLQHLAFWTALSSGQLQCERTEFQVRLRELHETLQLWIVAGSPLWAACDPELYIRPDGHWSGTLQLGTETFWLDPDHKQAEPLEILWARWEQSWASEVPPFCLWDEVLEFVESASQSGLVIQAPSAFGKSHLLRRLQFEQIQRGDRACGWFWAPSRDEFSLEKLNDQLNELHRQGFPWVALSSDALADIQLHSNRETLVSHFWAACKERNQLASREVRIILLDDEPADLIWPRMQLPAQIRWICASQREWTLPVGVSLLPIQPRDPVYQKLAIEMMQPKLDWPRSQLLELLHRAQDDLLVVQLWLGALESGLVDSSESLPLAGESLSQILKLVLDDRGARPMCWLLSVEESGIPSHLLTQDSWGQSLRNLLQHYHWLVMQRQDGRLALRHPRLLEELLAMEGPERREAIAQFCRYLLVKLKSSELDFDGSDLLTWVAESGDAECAWMVFESTAFRTWREGQIAVFEQSGQAYRKIVQVSRWLQVVDLALEWSRQNTPLQVHWVLEERLWSLSSRALTYRGLGRLDRALQDIEQALAGFRPLGEQKPELLNGLAAACNRRSEILREQGHYEQALQDSDEAIALYRQIGANDPPRWEPLLALALHHRSLIFQDLGRLDEAENELRSSLHYYQPHRDQLRPRLQFDLLKAYLSRARLASLRGDGLLARDDSLRCLELLQRREQPGCEWDLLEAQAHSQLAEAYRRLDEKNRALEASHRAILNWKALVADGRLDLRSALADEMCNRGQLLFSLGEFDQAFEASQEAVESLLGLVEAEGRRDLSALLARALLLRGRGWQRRGRVESAKRDLILALHHVSQPSAFAIGIMVEATALLTQLNLALGQAEQAVEELRSCLDYLDLQGVGDLQEHRALLLSLLGRVLPAGPEALALHDRAVGYYNQLVDEQGHYQLLPHLAEAHLGRARTFRLLGAEEPALADANQAVELLTFLSQKGGDPEVLRLLPSARFEAAEILGSLGQRDRALEHLDGGLLDLELLESDFSQAEYFLERARALALKGDVLDDASAAGALSEALDLIARAGAQGAEIRFRDSEVRRRRAEVLLRLGRSSEAVEDLLGQSLDLADQERISHLLSGMLAEAARGSSYDRVLQVAELLQAHHNAPELLPALISAYRDRALRQWNVELPNPGLADFAQAIALSGLVGQPSVLAELLAQRAFCWRELGDQISLLLDCTRALELLSLPPLDPRYAGVLGGGAQPPLDPRYAGVLGGGVLPPLDPRSAGVPDLEVRLRRLRLEVRPQDPGCWVDLERLVQLLSHSADLGELLWALRAQANFFQRQGWLQQAAQVAERALEELSRWPQADSADRSRWMIDRFVWRQDFGMLLEWVDWVEEISRQGLMLTWSPELEMQVVREAYGQSTPAEQEALAQRWLALLTQYPQLPEAFFELVPACAASLRLDEVDSSAWISLMEIMDRRANDESPSRLTWEGQTLQHFLSLPRAEIGQNPDLEMALADCLRRWAELPAHRLALAGLSSEALASWLEG